MKISQTSRAILICLMSLFILNGCAHKKSIRLRKRAAWEIVGGMAYGSVITAGSVAGMAVIPYIFIAPLVAIPLAGFFVAKGIYDFKQAKKLKRLEKQEALAEAQKSIEKIELEQPAACDAQASAPCAS